MISCMIVNEKSIHKKMQDTLQLQKQILYCNKKRYSQKNCLDEIWQSRTITTIRYLSMIDFPVRVCLYIPSSYQLSIFILLAIINESH